jgi:hypothetical protein
MAACPGNGRRRLVHCMPTEDTYGYFEMGRAVDLKVLEH